MTKDSMGGAENLTPLQDFPDYYIDIHDGSVYSYRMLGGWCKKKVLRKLRGNTKGRNERNTQTSYRLIDNDGKVFYASLGRLMISATHGISYFVIPKDISCNYRPDTGITMRNRSEAASEAWQEKQREHHKTVIDNIERNIKTQGLLRDAYLGKRKPLFDYIQEHKGLTYTSIRHKTNWSKKRCLHSIDRVCDYLYEVLKGEHIANINNLDTGLVATAIALTRAEGSRIKHTVTRIIERKVYQQSLDQERYYIE